MPTRNLTIVFVDIQDYTARLSGGARDEVHRVQALIDRLLVPAVQHFEGRTVKKIGDALLLTFQSPTDAVVCGMTILEVLRQHNAATAEPDHLHVRIAIHCGDVEETADDIHGEPVNLAARLEGIAEAGEVYFTEAVYLAMNRVEAPSAEIGERLFKGIPYPVRVYKVIQGPQTPLSRRLAAAVRLTAQGPVIRDLHQPSSPAAGRPAVPGGPKVRWPLLIGGAFLGLAAVGYLALMSHTDPAETAFQKARTELDAGRPFDALETARAALALDPHHAGLKATRAKAAEKAIEQMRQTQGAATARDWLNEQLARSGELESLRPMVGELDSEATAQLIAQNLRSHQESLTLMRGILEKYPRDPRVPLVAARVLEKWDAAYAGWLYQQALDRGAPADEALKDFCLRMLPHHSPGEAQAVHRILKEHYPEMRRQWAEHILKLSANGQELTHAWQILRDLDHPALQQEHPRELIDLLDGYSDEAAANRALAHFLTVQEADERKRVVLLHRWVLKPVGVRGWGWTHKDLIERNLKKLESEWAIPGLPAA